MAKPDDYPHFVKIVFFTKNKAVIQSGMAVFLFYPYILSVKAPKYAL